GARAAHLSGPRLERLRLDERRIDAIAESIDAVMALPDPIGSAIAEWERPNGLRIQRVVVPLGVIGIIYESRPNVTADAGALCLKSGNAAILRGGSESQHSSRALHECLAHGLQSAARSVTGASWMHCAGSPAVCSPCARHSCSERRECGLSGPPPKIAASPGFRHRRPAAAV